MDTTEFDVFISYRNSYFELQADGTKRKIDVGFGVAKDVSGVLYSTNYRVYFDNLSLSCGDDYERHIFESIPQCRDVILILVPQALERCTGGNDIFGREIVAALEHGKNIIPVFVNGFTLPEMLRAPAKKYQERTGRSFVRLQGVKVRAEEKVSAENFQILKNTILAGVVPRLKSVPVQPAQLNPKPTDIPEGSTTPFQAKQEELRKKEEELRRQEERLRWEKEERVRREAEQKRLEAARREKEEAERRRREEERVQNRKNLLKLICSLAVLAIVAAALAQFLKTPAKPMRALPPPSAEVSVPAGPESALPEPSGSVPATEQEKAPGVPAPKPRSAEELVAAVKAEDADRVSEILASGTDVNAFAENGATALCSAALRSNVEVLSLLLDAGADPNLAMPKNGMTPLHIAVLGGNASNVKLLLAAGADTAAKTTGFFPPISQRATSSSGFLKIFRKGEPRRRQNFFSSETNLNIP